MRTALIAFGCLALGVAVGARAEQAEQGRGYADLDLGFETRAFPQSGLDGQDRLQSSISAKFSFSRSWDDDRQSFTVTPFARLDDTDSERSHFDLRELYWSRIGLDWELNVGARQVFWGVTEFKHLVDIVNQTDLAENIDGEDKLGQPMAQFSLVRDSGILDLIVMPMFRERTFPGEDGRLRYGIPIDTDHAVYEDDAEDRHVDGVVRWSQHIGSLSYGIYHFAGTSRDPLFTLSGGGDSDLELVPYYPQINQTGLDAQLVAGDWAFKVEAIRRAGFNGDYGAMNAGFERTLVGVMGSRADVGLVVEYMYDERGDDAFDTLFERDLALGTRFSFNDAADTQALAGFIVDRETHERVLSLEATRRFGDNWLFSVESRVFAGSDTSDPGDPEAMLFEDDRSASLQRDDYLQLEVTRYF